MLPRPGEADKVDRQGDRRLQRDTLLSQDAPRLVSLRDTVHKTCVVKGACER